MSKKKAETRTIVTFPRPVVVERKEGGNPHRISPNIPYTTVPGTHPAGLDNLSKTIREDVLAEASKEVEPKILTTSLGGQDESETENTDD